MKRFLVSLLVLLMLVGISVAYHISKDAEDLPVIDVMLNGNAIPVEVASTAIERTRGLSDREELSTRAEGLLFLFDEADKYGIWMKDMNFAIDIMWFDTDGRLIHLVQNALPESFPNVFTPPDDALYILEVEAGFTSLYDLRIGDMLNVEA